MSVKLVKICGKTWTFFLLSNEKERGKSDSLCVKERKETGMI